MVHSFRVEDVKLIILRLQLGLILQIEKRILHTPRKALSLITPPSARRQRSLYRRLKKKLYISVQFLS